MIRIFCFVYYFIFLFFFSEQKKLIKFMRFVRLVMFDVQRILLA